MPLSTSNSSFGAYKASARSHSDSPVVQKVRGVHGHLVLLIACLAASTIFLEVGTRLAFSHISRIEQRIAREHAEALAIRPDSTGRSVLLVGNSLLLLGVDYDLLRQTLPARVRPHRFVIENTQLLDWEFGLRRLFEDGSRPDVVAISVGETNMLPTSIRGEYSAYYLFRTSDIPEIADSVGYDNTRLSNLYFARYSLFFAGRSGLRNFVLNRVDPPYGRLLHTFDTGAGRRASSERVEVATAERLAAVRAVAAQYGARLLLIVPPGFATDIEAAVKRGAAKAQVAVIAPVPQGAWGSELFSDGYHLNEPGSREFTKLVLPRLAAMVAEGADVPVVSSVSPVTP